MVFAFSIAYSDNKYALIYNGPCSAEEAPEALADAAKAYGFHVKFISDIKKLPGMLKNALIFMIGGTDDNEEPIRNSFTPEIKKALREYLLKGGRFAGICGGAFLASAGYEESEGFVKVLEIVPAQTDYFISTPPPLIIPVNWKGVVRNMYLQQGPKFQLLKTDEKVEIIAKYSDGSIAAMICSLGRGKVFVSGPHPEAPLSWIEDTELSRSGWQPTLDLMQDALKMVMKFKA